MGAVALLLASIAAGPMDPTVLAAAERAAAAWGPPIVDVRRRAKLAPEERGILEAIGREYRDAGFDLRVVLVDSTPTFSLGDFTSRLYETTRCHADCLYLTATEGGVHSASRWHTYRDARRLARAVQAEFDVAPIPALATYARSLIGEGRRRARHRHRMLAVAVAALLGLILLTARAARRRARAAT